MKDKWRGLAELLGLSMVAASLLFVAIQMEQEQRIAKAALNTSQLELYSSRHSAGIESDAYLAMWNKLYPTNAWETTGLSDLEIAAAELDALLWWAYAEATFEQYREGLVSEYAWKEAVLEINHFLTVPAHRAVFDYWYSKVPSEFTGKVDEIIKRSNGTSGA